MNGLAPTKSASPLWLEALTPAEPAARPVVHTPRREPAVRRLPLEPVSSGERVAYHTAWIQHARHSINNPRLAGKIAFDGASDGLYANGRFATDASAWEHLDLATYRPAITSLPRLLMMSKEELVARVADALCDLDDVKVETVVSHVAERLYRAPVVTQLRVGVDLDILAAFLDKNQDAIRATMRTRFAAERREDVARTIADLAAYPQLSAHEVWLQGAGAKRHRDVSYFADLRANELAPYLTRPVDRMGNEPNYLLAAQLARFLLGAEPGTSFSSAVADFKELAWDASLAPQGWTDFTVADAERLSRIYTFIPCWHTGAKGPYDLGIDDLPEDIHSRFTKLAQVPFSTSIMRDYAALRGERGGLAGSLLVTTEHALADKIDLFRHLIVEDGMAGKDIRVVWKHHSADPLVIELCERLFGVTGEKASPRGVWTADTRLEWLASGALEQAVRDASADGRTVNVHLQGVRSWGVAGELKALYPNVPINACSHTTSEVPEILTLPEGLEDVALAIMATCEAKIRYERHVFTLSFMRLVLDIEKALESEIGVVRGGRRFLVYGGAGRIIGGAVVDALRNMKKLSVAVVDPWLATPEGKAKREALIAQGVDIIDSDAELEHELRTKSLFIVNATADDAFYHRDYTRIGKNKAVVLNLGTGQRGFSMKHLEELAFDQRTGGLQRRRLVGEIDRHQASYAYKILNDQGLPVDVFALGDGAVYNLGERSPNPRELSAFNNLLILESLHQAAHDRSSGLLGPRVLGSVRVAFTDEADPRPVIAFLPRDMEHTLPWPKIWPDAIAADHDGPVIRVDLTKSPDEVRRIAAHCVS